MNHLELIRSFPFIAPPTRGSVYIEQQTWEDLNQPGVCVIFFLFFAVFDVIIFSN